MRKKTSLTRSLLAACSIVALSAVMYGCVHSDDDPATTPIPDTPDTSGDGGDGDAGDGDDGRGGDGDDARGGDGDEPPTTPTDPVEPDPVDPAPTAYESGRAAIQAAETPEAARAAYDAVDRTMITAAEDALLQAALEAALDAFATTAAAEERAAIVEAAMCTDATAECLEAHNALIEVLEAEHAELQADDDATNAQVNAAAAAVTAAKTARDAVQMAIDGIGTMDTERMAVNNAITAAMMAIASLDEDSTAEDVTAARDAVNAAQDALDAAESLSDEDTADLQAMVDAIDTTNLEAQETRLAEAAEEKRLADEKAARDALTKAAGTKATAIAAEAVQTPDAGLGGSTASALTAGDPGSYTLDIKRDRSDTTVTVTVEGATDAADEDFVLDWPTGEGPNGQGFMLSRTHDADTDGNVMEERAFVFTDIEAPTATPFGEVHELDIRVDGETATDADPNDALNVAVANLAHVKASAFTAPAGSPGTTILNFQHEVEADPANNVEAMDAAEIAGTYEGAPGVYKCNATAACTVTVNAEGVVSGVSNDNDWIFIPADMAMVDVADTDYLHYGFWLKNTTDADGVLTYNEVETFAGSSVPATASLADVAGTATYSGGANGVYVRNVFGSDGTVDSATSGHFGALANLTATFGDVDVSSTVTTGTIAPNMLNTLTGSIHTFALYGEEGDAVNAWADRTVALQGSITALTDGLHVTGGTAKGGVEGTDGSFSATFHGTATGDANANLESNDSVYPSSVVGEFNASFSDGSLAGAFGARIDKEDE